MKVRVALVREGRPTNAKASSPEETYRFLKPKVRGLVREHVWRIDLDARNNILDYEVVSIGTLTASLIHPREVYTGAMLAGAAGIIIAHNHPSDDASPSPEDKDITTRLGRAGEILGIPLVDHVIITSGGYFSFRERGLL